VTTTVPVHVCDACNAERWGASKRDVLEEGWKFHDAKRGRMFVMCGSCEQRFGAQRPAAAA
jgi:transcription elongation factor Elf1